MPLVLGGPWQGGFFGSANVGLDATATLSVNQSASASIALTTVANLTNAGSGADWDLGTYAEAENFSARIVNPRPDAERGTGSAYSYAHSGMEYRHRIYFVGGSFFPRIYISASGGTAAGISTIAVVNETYTLVGDVWQRPAGYGEVRWTPDAADNGETFFYTVTVEFQDGQTQTVTVNGTVNDSQFIFYDSTDTESLNLGTLAEPYNVWSSAWGSTAAQSINGDKVCVFRAGTHIVSGYPDSNGNLNVSLAPKPNSMIAYPGESPILDLNNSVQINVNAQSDFMFYDLTFRNNGIDGDGRGYVIRSTGQKSRQVISGNRFESFIEGTNLDVAASIYFSSSGDPSTGGGHQDISVCDNTLTGTQSTWLLFYASRNFAVYGNTFDNVTLAVQQGERPAMIYQKSGQHYRISVIDNDFTDVTNPTTTAPTSIFHPQSQQLPYGGNTWEWMYNRAYFTSTAGRDAAFRQHQGNQTIDDGYIGRNSIVGTFRWDSGNASSYPSPTYEHFGNLSTQADENQTVPVFSRFVDNDDSAPLNTDGTIQAGAYRNQYLGIRGAEISTLGTG